MEMPTPCPRFPSWSATWSGRPACDARCATLRPRSMGRLLLLTALAVATWLYFPETRSMLLDVAEPIVLPVMRWSTEEEMATIARNAVDQERLTGYLPVGGGWLDWLQYRYVSDEARMDPWGSTYQLEVSKDSVWTLSYGPDRTRGTSDDFRVSMPRGL